jgi:hypothetical protein
MFACSREKHSFAWNPEMFKKARNGFCLSLVVGFFMASPWNHRLPLNSTIYSFLTHAGKKESKDSRPVPGSLAADRGKVCFGVPEYAKGIPASPSPTNPNPSPVSRSVPGSDRKEAVLALIHYPWQDLGFNIEFMGSRRGYRAMTLTTRHRIEVYARPGDGMMQQAYDLAHELGHAFDLKHNNEERRLKWRALRGIELSTPWFGCSACPDYGTPAGDFAETFAFLLLGPGNFHSTMAPLPAAGQIPELAAFCQIEHLSTSLRNPPVSKENRVRETAQQERKVEMLNSPKDESVDYQALPSDNVTTAIR